MPKYTITERIYDNSKNETIELDEVAEKLNRLAQLLEKEKMEVARLRSLCEDKNVNWIKKEAE